MAGAVMLALDRRRAAGHILHNSPPFWTDREMLMGRLVGRMMVYLPAGPR
jgi:hypothetical protein